MMEHSAFRLPEGEDTEDGNEKILKEITPELSEAHKSTNLKNQEGKQSLNSTHTEKFTRTIAVKSI